MKQMLILSLLLLPMLSLYANEEGDELFEFTNGKGTVTFNHTMHMEMLEDCALCHPPLPQEYNDDVSIKKIAHTTCKTCHKDSGGPTKCNECHVKQFY